MPPGRGSSSALVPSHSTCFSGTVRYSKIVAGLASITISLISSAIRVLPPLPSLGSLGDVAQPLQPPGPVVVEEPAQLLHGLGTGPVQTPCPVATLAHQRGLTQDPEVLRDRRAGDVPELGGDVARRQLPGPYQPDDLPPTGLGQSLEGRIHTGKR